MKINSDTFSETTKNYSRANVEAIENFMTYGINSLGKTSDVSVAYAKDISKSFFEAVEKLLHAANVNEIGQIVTSSAEPLSAKVTSYVHKIYDINSCAQHEVNSLAKVRFDDSYAHFYELTLDLGKATPVGVEPMFELFKSNMEIWKSGVDKLANANTALNENFRDQLDSYLKDFISSKVRKVAGKTNDGEAQAVPEYAADTEGGGVE